MVAKDLQHFVLLKASLGVRSNYDWKPMLNPLFSYHSYCLGYGSD